MRKTKHLYAAALAIVFCAAALFIGGFFYGQYNYPEAKARRAAYGYLEEAGLLPENTEIRPESGVVFQWAPDPSSHPGFTLYESSGVPWPEGVPVRTVSFDLEDVYAQVYLHPESLELLHIEH